MWPQRPCDPGLGFLKLILTLRVRARQGSYHLHVACWPPPPALPSLGDCKSEPIPSAPESLWFSRPGPSLPTPDPGLLLGVGALTALGHSIPHTEREGFLPVCRLHERGLLSGKDREPRGSLSPGGPQCPSTTPAPGMEQGCSGFIVSCPFSPVSAPAPPTPLRC